MIGATLALPSTLEALSKRSPLRKTTRILWAGTSSEAARWCGSGPKGMGDARDKGYVMIAGKQLAVRGLPVNTQGYFGEQNNDRSIAALVDYDRRLHDLAGLTVDGSLSQMGGYPLRFAPGVAGSYAIDFQQPGDTIAFYVSAPQLTQPAPGDRGIDYAIDDEPVRTIAFVDAAMQRVVVPNLGPGLHRLRLSTAADSMKAPINFHGAECYPSSEEEILFMPVGARAWNTSDRNWTRTGPYSAIAMLPVIRPDIVIATFGGGDEDDYGGFQTRCQIWGDAVVAAGARPLFIGKPYRKAAYYEALAALSEKYGTPTRNMGMIDEKKAIERGEKAADNLHFLAPWHKREGEALGDWLFETALPQMGVLR